MWVLVIEDEVSMGDLLLQALREDNHTVTLTRDGMDGLHIANTSAIDAIVLDVNLPGVNGFEIARRLRQTGHQVPILMLTARDAVADVVQGLDAGADDYLTKPFPLKELLARLRALARRGARSTVNLFRVGDLTLDPGSHEVLRAGVPIELTSTEFRLLEFLMRRSGRACSRSAIIDGVWGIDKDVEFNTVDAFIRLLRLKVDSGRKTPLIQTMRGYGYILRDEP
jgi:DNA-binding response OmpR family regulator